MSKFLTPDEVVHYSSTAEDVAKLYNISPKSVINWAKFGYPVTLAGAVQLIKLEGARRTGRQWRFNIKVVSNFIECVGDEQWVLLNGNIKQERAKKLKLKTGQSNFTLTDSDTAKLLKELVTSRKRMQTSSAMH